MELLTTPIAASTANKPHSGNKCGHIRQCPQFFVRPAEQKKTYSSLHIASEHLTEYYFQPVDNWLPNIHAIRDSKRQQRSERREAISAMAGVMVNHLDMATMKIMRVYKGELVEMSVKELAQKASLHLRRAERALKDLREAGYLELQYRVEHMPDGTIKPKIAIKRLTALFFYHLGISFEKLRKECERARAQFKRFNKKARMKAAEMKAGTEGFFSRFLKKTGYQPRNTVKKSSERARREAQLWHQLRQEHPDWTLTQIKQQAQATLAA
jgi:DNA-binding transcriptional ArsR family regulator